ncbi:MAG: DUF308 domain-containing protein [Bacteroidales bacterium]|jgi:uncharacterized membrane protein HdeD (DUF308 family)|nr:DUF308 domain-containing protein [Bacteroidales bacterium]
MATKRFKNWWFLALNGIIFVLFGILILLNTPDFIKTMITYFGIVLLVFGAILLIIGVNNFRKEKQAGMILYESIAAIAIGLILTFFPEGSVNLFMILVGVWIIIIGIIQLVILANLKESSSSLKNGLLINGLLTIALGIALFFNPFSWAVFLVKLIGVLAAIFGLLLICFSFVLRSVSTSDTTAPQAIK